MKRTTSTSTYDVPDYKAPVVKEHKIPVLKSPTETKPWPADPIAVSTRAEEDGRRKAPEMKFMYLVSGCMTVLVIWGIVREVSYRFPLLLYGEGNVVDKDVMENKMIQEITAANVATIKLKDDPILSRSGRRDARRFLEKYPYSLGTKISDWDQQRQDYAASVVPKNTAGSRIYLVSGSQPTSCPNTMGDHYYLKFLKNRVDYCRLHGIRNHLYNMADVDEGVNRLWVKLPVIRFLMLEHADIEWFLWMDSDALITDMNYEIPLARYKKHNFVITGSKDRVYDKKQWSGLSTGVFLIRNCQWSLDFLEAWAVMADKEFEEKWGIFLSEHLTERSQTQPAEDQSAAVYLLANDPTRWSSKVYMEKADDLSRPWKEVDFIKLSTREGKTLKRPFVSHFSGCQSCSGGPNNATIALCQGGMEKAFNFADNQVLSRYGYLHHDLSSFAVRPLPSGVKKQ